MASTTQCAQTVPAFANKQMLIDGAWVDALDGQVFAVENPARKEKIGQAPRAQSADVERAVLG